jgi:DNA-binding Xre family transcriptional regulator
MISTVQMIERNGRPEWAVLPYEDYLQLVEEAEMLEDIRDYDRIKAEIAAGEQELIPGEVVFALLDGENPIKVWRVHRGLTQRELAEATGLTASYLSQLENNRRVGTIEALTAVARALSVSLDDLIP